MVERIAYDRLAIKASEDPSHLTVTCGKVELVFSSNGQPIKALQQDKIQKLILGMQVGLLAPLSCLCELVSETLTSQVRKAACSSHSIRAATLASSGLCDLLVRPVVLL